MTDDNAGRDGGRVLSPQPGPPFRGPAYEYICARDNVPLLGAQDGRGDGAEVGRYGPAESGGPRALRK